MNTLNNFFCVYQYIFCPKNIISLFNFICRQISDSSLLYITTTFFRYIPLVTWLLKFKFWRIIKITQVNYFTHKKWKSNFHLKSCLGPLKWPCMHSLSNNTSIIMLWKKIFWCVNGDFNEITITISVNVSCFVKQLWNR